MEQWIDVVGYSGLYGVGDLGTIKSLDRVVPHTRYGTMKVKGRIMRPVLHLDNKGRIVRVAVALCKEGVKTNKYIHRLVLEAWVGPCPDGHEGCHEDGDATNNAVCNLRWGSHASNVQDSIRHGMHNVCPVRRSDGVIFVSIAEAARQTGCATACIWRACNGKRKSAGGYGWAYCEE
jgi:hypothetical protein